MPVLKASKKSMRQDVKRKARNYPLRNEVKTLVKKELKLIEEGKLDEAKKLLPYVYKVIDTACKKYIIHRNNAARKKSRIARALNAYEIGGKKVEIPKESAVKIEAKAAESSAKAKVKTEPKVEKKEEAKA